MKVKIHNRKNFNYSIILIISIILSIPLLSKNLNIYNQNGFFDIAEGYEFSKNFQINDGKIFSSFYYGLGTGNIILKAPLKVFVLFLINYLLDSFIISYKITVFLCLIFSGIYMHKFIDKVTLNKNIALLSSILYISAPFHLNQMYISNNLSNCLALVFLPMTFYGLYKMFNTTEHSFHVGIGVIGLVLTDLNLALIAGISIFVYITLNIKNWRIEHVKKAMIINFLAIISITSFFVFPLIETNLKCDYVNGNNSEFLANGLTIKSLFVTSNNSKEVYEFGPHIIIMLAFSIMAINRLKENKLEYIFCFIMMVIYIFMSTKYFPWQFFSKFICNLENTEIFLLVSVFFQSIVAAFNMSVVLKQFNTRDVLIISVISLLYVIALKGFVVYGNNIMRIQDYNFAEVKENEYLPKKTYNNLKYIDNRSIDVEVIKGNAEIWEKSKFLTYYSFKSNTLEKDTIYEFPYLYYPGYEIRYDGILIDYFESENGLVAIKMNPEEGTYYELNYVGTELMNITKIISFCSLCVFGVYIYKKR